MFELPKRSNAPILKSSLLSRWLPVAILISLSAHIAFLWWTRGITWHHRALLSSTSPSPQPPQQTRPFHLVKSSLPIPSSSLPVQQEQKTALPPQTPLILPIEKMVPKPDMGTLPTENLNSPPKTHQALLEEKPGDVGNSLNSIIQKTVAENAEKGPVFQEHLMSSTDTLVQSLQGGEKSDTTQMASSGRQPGFTIPQGFSHLDALLSQTGPLKPETAPILMPTDVLFEYDNAELRSEAIESLHKLGTLIKRNPQVTFVIEGHTDSFGSENYNMDLSIRRAEAVKNWLIQTMNILRIATQGYGKSRLLVPASGSVSEQQLNRRVEITIHVPKP